MEMKISQLDYFNFSKTHPFHQYHIHLILLFLFQKNNSINLKAIGGFFIIRFIPIYPVLFLCRVVLVFFIISDLIISVFTTLI